MSSFELLKIIKAPFRHIWPHVIMTVPISRQVARGGLKSMLEATIRTPNNGLLTNSELVGCSISDAETSSDRISSDHYTWTSKVPAELKAGQYVSAVQISCSSY